MIKSDSEMKYTHIRRARKAECIQWAGENTEEVLEFLGIRGFRGEIFRDYIQIYDESGYWNTLRNTDWVVERENGEIRFYNNETMELMYEPKTNELERLRGFARDMMSVELAGFQTWQREKIAEKHGITIESLEAGE